jgi:hypothetical protein
MVSGMTDVMSHGVYPHDPLPGPRERVALERAFQPIFWPHYTPEQIEQRVTERYLAQLRKTNPILEPPVYFPGATWKQNRVYA